MFLTDCSVVPRWQKDPSYCDTVKQTPPYNHGTRLVDLIDMAVLDFLMGQSRLFKLNPLVGWFAVQRGDFPIFPAVRAGAGEKKICIKFVLSCE